MRAERHIVSFPAEPSGGEPKFSKRRLAIMTALATGWLPWGVEWKARLTLHNRAYILCCGHALGKKEAQAFVDAGLLQAGQETYPTLVITDRGLSWLGSQW